MTHFPLLSKGYEKKIGSLQHAVIVLCYNHKTKLNAGLALPQRADFDRTKFRLTK